MSFEFSDAMLGALFGIVATLLGSWSAYRLTAARDRVARHAEIRDALRTVAIDLKAQERALDPKDHVHTLEATTYQLLTAKGVLSEIPDGLAFQIASVFHVFSHVNESIRFKDQAVLSVVASGAFERSSADASGLFDNIHELKSEAQKLTAECILAINRFVAET